MSDIKTAHNTTETELNDGTTIYINGKIKLKYMLIHFKILNLQHI